MLIESLRFEKRRPTVPLLDDDHPSGDSLAPVIFEQVHRVIERMRKVLSSRQMVIFEMRYLEEMTIAAIARELGLSRHRVSRELEIAEKAFADAWLEEIYEWNSK